MPEQLNVGTIVGYLTLDDKGVDKGARSATQRIQQFAKTGAAEGGKAGTAIGTAAGSKTVSAFGKSEGALKSRASSMFGSVAGVATGILGGIGVAQILTKGWDRLTGIENAQAKLKGLGHDAGEVQKIMDNALASVKGTAFGLGDAASIAAGAVAAGVKPGQDLERTLKLVADSAAIAGTDLGSMGSIFNKVAANGKLTGEVLQQLQDQGVPVLQFLSKQLHTTAADVSAMVSKGQIDFKTFENAMEQGVGGSAQAMGDTTTGALMNMGAAAGRFGATLLQDVQPVVKSVAAGAITVFDQLGGAVTTTADAIGKVPGPVKAAGAAFIALAIAQKVGLFVKLSDAIVLTRVRLSELADQAKSGALKDNLTAIGKQGAVLALVSAGVGGLTKAWGDYNKVVVDSNTLIDENTGKLTDSARTDIAKALLPHMDSIQKAGLTMSQVVDAVIAGGGQLADVTNKLDNAGGVAKGILDDLGHTFSIGWWSSDADHAANQVRTLGEQLAATRKSATEYADEQAKAAAASREATTATAAVASATDAARDSATSSVAAWGAYGASLSVAAKLQDDSKRSAVGVADAWQHIGQVSQAALDPIGAMSAAVSVFDKTTSDANTTVKFFSMSIDELSGRNVNLQDAQIAVRSTMDDLADAFTKNEDATRKNVAAIEASGDALDTTNPLIVSTYDNLSKARDAYDQVTGATYQAAVASGDMSGALGKARDAADDAREQFIDQVGALLHNKDAAAALANQLGILEGKKLTDKDFRVSVEDEATARLEALQKYHLADKIMNVSVAVQDAELRQLQSVGDKRAGHATGGPIVGPGTGTSDSILARLSNGEYVVNARSASKHRGLLDIINGSPGFADGGIVGPTSQQLSGLPAAAVGPILGAVQSALAQFADTVTQTADALTDANQKASDARQKVTDLTAQYRENAASARENMADTVKSTAATVSSAKERLAEAQARLAAAKKGSKERTSRAAAVTKAQKAVTAAEDKRTDAIAKAQKAVDKSTAADLKKLNAAKATAAQANADAATAKARAGAIANLQVQSQFLQRTQERLADQLDQTNTALDAATSTLANLQQQSQQLHDSVAGKITGDASITGLNPGSTVQNIIDFLSGQATQSSALSGSLSALANRGLNGTILQDIAGMGLSGGAIASTLAGASSSQIAQINGLQAQIASAADRSGKVVADAIYANDISLWQQQVDYLDQRQADLEDALQKNADALSAAIDASLTANTKATVNQLKVVATNVQSVRAAISRLAGSITTSMKAAVA